MKLNNKEKYIKQVLENQHSSVNTPALWDAIEDRVPYTESKPKRRLWIFILPFVLGALAISTVWYVSDQMSNPEKKVSQVIENPNNLETLEASTAETALLNQTKETQTLEVDQPIAVKVNKANTEVVINEQATQKTPLAKSKTQTQSVTQQHKNTAGETHINTNTNTFSTVGPTKSIQVKQRQNSASTPNNLKSEQTPAELSPNSESEVKPLVQLVSSIGRLKATLLLMAQPLLGRLEASISKDKSINDEGRNSAKWSLIASGGTNLVRSQESIEPSSVLRTEEFANEQQLLGYQANVGLQRLSSNNWSVKAQLGMATNVTRYQSDEQLLIKNEVDDAVTEIYNGNTVNSVEVTGEAQTFTQVNQDVIWHRSHQQYSIDLFLGKQFDINSKFSLLAEAGMINTFYQKHNGYYFADALKAFTQFESGEASPYQTGYRLNGALATSLSYNINNQFSIGLGTSAVLPFNLIEDSGYYQTKNSQLRFDFLVGYKLN